MFWHPAILQGFKSANASIALEPTSVKDCLQKSDESVEDFDRRVSESSITSKVERIPEFQHYLLGSLRHPSLVGKYSTYWEMAIYKFGYSHPYTVELAYLYVTLSYSWVTYHSDDALHLQLLCSSRWRENRCYR